MPLTPAFKRDLKRVFAADPLDDVCAADLRALENHIKKWSAESKQELKVLLGKFPSDHPVKCPISLFGPMGDGRREVAHTRTLAWLLNPAEKHGFQSRLLQSLFKHFSFCDGDEKRLCVLKVQPERLFRNAETGVGGRTDVWIEGRWEDQRPMKHWLFVMEAKIGAIEGNDQLTRYNDEIKKWQRENKASPKQVLRVFLTPDGRKPDGGGADWQTLSFSELARVFCQAARALQRTEGYHFLRYYVAAVLQHILDLPTGCAEGHRNRYKLLGFLKELLAANSGGSTR